MKNILLLADTGHHTTAVQDHIKAMTAYSSLNWFIENPLTCKILYKFNFLNFDAIGIHYSIKIYNNYYLSKKTKEKIAYFSGVKFVFLQDEYANVNKTVSTLIDLDIDLLFTLVDEKYVDQVYFHEKLKKVKKITVLTGYVSDLMKKIPYKPLENRPLDIFYRSRIYPFSLGCLAQERILIAEGVMHRAAQYDLKCDISLQESKRVYGQAWMDSLQSARAVLGTESGASILDETGEIAKKVKKLFSKNPMMDFSLAYKEFLFQYESNIYYATISPRLFEAAATRTAMILFPGEYNGILQKNVHYIVLNKDFSNFSEVVNKLRDSNYLEQITDRVYNDLILSGYYADEKFSKLLEDELLNTLNRSVKNRVFVSDSIVNSDLNRVKSRNTLINFIHVVMAECKFVFVNFCIFLFDSQYSGKNKLFSIFEGVKRYRVYLAKRLTRNKEIFYFGIRNIFTRKAK
jgi:hypothetical protein